MKTETVLRRLTGLLVVLAAMTATAAELVYDAADGSGVPSSVAAGYTELVVRTGEPAAVTLVRLHDDADPAAVEAGMAEVNAGIAGQADFGAAVRALFEMADLVLEVDAAPEGSSTVGTVLAEGRYAIQYVPMGEEGPTGAPVYTYFEAVGAGDAAPQADATVDLADFTFDIPADLTAGEQTWQVINGGEQIHHMVIFKLNDDATFEDFTAWMQSEQGPPPGQEAGYVGVFGPGQTIYQTLDLSAGNYVAICFIPDHAASGTGAPHFVHGMIQPFQVAN